MESITNFAKHESVKIVTESQVNIQNILQRILTNLMKTLLMDMSLN
jgi:hypothetical protein